MELREWLEEKRQRGIKQVRVTSVLEKLDATVLAEAPPPRRKPGQLRNGRVTITADDLLGAAEVAELLKVDRTRPSKWRIKDTTFGPDKIPFPEPFAERKTGPIWLRSQIEPLIPFVEGRRRPHRD